MEEVSEASERYNPSPCEVDDLSLPHVSERAARDNFQGVLVIAALRDVPVLWGPSL